MLLPRFLWRGGRSECEENVTGARIFLDSGTLTPLLRKLEAKGYVRRKKDESDDRNLLVEVTAAGIALRDRALSVPGRVASCVNLEPGEAAALYATLRKILSGFADQ